MVYHSESENNDHRESSAGICITVKLISHWWLHRNSAMAEFGTKEIALRLPVFATKTSRMAAGVGEAASVPGEREAMIQFKPKL